MCAGRAHEFDGLLIPHRRLADLSIVEMLNFTLAHLLEGADADHRRKIQLAMEGRLGSSGGEIVDDPDLPEALQGMEAPSWWSSDDDPFANQHDLGSTDTRFHAT